MREQRDFRNENHQRVTGQIIGLVSCNARKFFDLLAYKASLLNLPADFSIDGFQSSAVWLEQIHQFQFLSGGAQKGKPFFCGPPVCASGIQIFVDDQAYDAATVSSRFKADFPIDRVALFHGRFHFYLGTFGLFGQHHIQTFLGFFIAHTGQSWIGYRKLCPFACHFFLNRLNPHVGFGSENRSSRRHHKHRCTQY